MKIGRKLILSHLLIALIPAVILGVVLAIMSHGHIEELDTIAHEKGVMVVVHDAREELRHQTEAALLANTLLKKENIEDYFTVMEGQLHVAKDNPYVMNALIKFETVFAEGGNLVKTDEWKVLAGEYDSFFTDIVKSNHWYDLFLVNETGDIVYTQAKESDLGMDLTKEPLLSSGLGKVFTKLRQNAGLELSVADFASYAPSNGEQAAFMMARLENSEKALVGYIAFQINPTKINEIVQQRVGLGKTGETYLVGQASDGSTSLRSDRIIKRGAIGQAKSDKIIEKAIKGASGVEVKTGSTGEQELVCYAAPKAD